MYVLSTTWRVTELIFKKFMFIIFAIGKRILVDFVSLVGKIYTEEDVGASVELIWCIF